MNEPIPNRPLWEVMQSAYFKVWQRNGGISEPYAAELRAIAEELAKKQSEWRANCTDMSAVMWLMEEAARAEAGE